MTRAAEGYVRALRTVRNFINCERDGCGKVATHLVGDFPYFTCSRHTKTSEAQLEADYRAHHGIKDRVSR